MEEGQFMLKCKCQIIRTIGIAVAVFLFVGSLAAYDVEKVFADSIRPLDTEDVSVSDDSDTDAISIDDADISFEESYEFTGEPVVPDVTVTLYGQELVADTDYYIEIADNDAPGKASLTVHGIGSYTGEKTVFFSIYGWTTEDGNSYYIEKNGEIAKDKWIEDETGRRYVGRDGRMLSSGWIKTDNCWYYLKDNGYMAYGQWVKDSNSWCYLGDDGVMFSSRWLKWGGKWYYLNGAGYMATNKWVQDSNGWCYVGNDGVMLSSTWLRWGGKWYYLNGAGYMATSRWIDDPSGWCYVCSDGTMLSSTWFRWGGYWYYLNSSGYMLTNTWVKDPHGWCYVGNDGTMYSSRWLKYGAGWYYLKANGYMAANEWVRSNGSWYWNDGNGVMAANKWLKIGNCWYKFLPNGMLETSPYVYVSISEQTLYYCSGGNLVMKTPVVTGSLSPKDHSTPKGEFQINGKATNVHLKGYEDDGVTEYDSFVRYWMPFLGRGWGLHDADWRYSFGGHIYKYDGSHGCVNMPFEAAKSLYERISVGTLVVIQ